MTNSPTPHTVRQDLDHRIELVSMDRYCADITVALYLLGDGRTAVVHSYSNLPAVPERLAWIADAMRALGGMLGVDRTVTFACPLWHERAARRVFLEACKADPTTQPTARPLAVDDPRTSQSISINPLGNGSYQVHAIAADDQAVSRAGPVAGGLVKLADLDSDAGDPTLLHFPCGAPHDELVGVLLPRAINVRAALREQEMAAERGILVAPSAQEAGA